MQKSKSQELKEFSEQLDFSICRFFIAPDKKVTKEEVIEDVLHLFRAIKEGKQFVKVDWNDL